MYLAFLALAFQLIFLSPYASSQVFVCHGCERSFLLLMVIVLIAAIEFIRYREIETVLQPICSTCIIL